MTEITFAQSSPKGNATIDTKRVFVDTDGNAWFSSWSPGAHGLVPMTDEQAAALEAHFGPTWRDALAAMKALFD